MSPEQIRARPLDARSDLWSLGVVLWESVAGEKLFTRDNDAATLHAAEDAAQIRVGVAVVIDCRGRGHQQPRQVGARLARKASIPSSASRASRPARIFRSPRTRKSSYRVMPGI